MPFNLLASDKIRIVRGQDYADYRIQLKEIQSRTGDGSCVDYPTPDHVTYADCIEAELRAMIMPALGRVSDPVILYRFIALKFSDSVHKRS